LSGEFKPFGSSRFRKRDFKLTLSPGFRAAVTNPDNCKSSPVRQSLSDSIAKNHGVLLYFSIEHDLF